MRQHREIAIQIDELVLGGVSPEDRMLIAAEVERRLGPALRGRGAEDVDASIVAAQVAAAVSNEAQS
jgi:hypothetical protein